MGTDNADAAFVPPWHNALSSKKLPSQGQAVCGRWAARPVTRSVATRVVMMSARGSDSSSGRPASISGSEPGVAVGSKSKKKKKNKMEAEHGVLVSRELIQTSVRRGRELRLRRWVTLGELGMVEGDDLSDIDVVEDVDALLARRVNVWLVVQRLAPGDYRVLGRTNTFVRCTCARCALPFDAVSDGRFDLVLVQHLTPETERQYDEFAEAIEPFDQQADDIDVSPHVRDAVLLGLPTQTTCGADCPAARTAGVQRNGRRIVYSTDDSYSDRDSDSDRDRDRNSNSESDDDDVKVEEEEEADFENVADEDEEFEESRGSVGAGGDGMWCLGENKVLQELRKRMEEER